MLVSMQRIRWTDEKCRVIRDTSAEDIRQCSVFCIRTQHEGQFWKVMASLLLVLAEFKHGFLGADPRRTNTG